MITDPAIFHIDPRDATQAFALAHNYRAYWLKRQDAPRGLMFLLPDAIPDPDKASALQAAVKHLLGTEGVSPN